MGVCTAPKCFKRGCHTLWHIQKGYILAFQRGSAVCLQGVHVYGCMCVRGVLHMNIFYYDATIPAYWRPAETGHMLG